MAERGVVAAGHPLTAAAGADVLRAGGNAVDAALAALMMSFMTEPLLTGLGAGGYMLVAPPGGAPVLLDFMVEAPGRGASPASRAPLDAVVIDFGDAVQVFHIGASSCGVYGMPAGIASAAERFGTRAARASWPRPRSRSRARASRSTRRRRYLWELLGPDRDRRRPSRATATASTAACRAPARSCAIPDLADGIARLAADGAAPFYTGDIGTAVSDWVTSRGGTLTRADLAAYATVPREPVHVRYHGREVLTNPPPSAGGILIAYALALLERGARPAGAPDAIVDAMEAAQSRAHAGVPRRARRAGLPGARSWRSRLGSTTHVSVLDADGWACAVTTTNGEGSGLVVPGTGIHVNNMMGEQDLSPAGWFTHPPGPPAAVDDGADDRARRRLAGAGARLRRLEPDPLRDPPGDRQRDRPRDGRAGRRRRAAAALRGRARLRRAGHRGAPLEAAGRQVAWFRERNLFFGGCQAVERHHGTGAFSGGGDPRRGGAVVAV